MRFFLNHYPARVHLRSFRHGTPDGKRLVTMI
jgi:hypothetical protein